MDLSAFQAGKIIKVAGYIGLSKALLLAKIHQNTQRTICWITADLKEALLLQKDFENFFPAEEILLIPPLDTLPYYSLSPNADLLMDRQSALAKLLDQTRKPKIVLIHLQSLMRKVIPRHVFLEKTVHLERAPDKPQSFNHHQLTQKLIENGYERTPLVEDLGTFAIRGGIIDIFSPTENYPARIDLFGDTIENIRLFEPSTQKTIQNITRFQIIPAREILFHEPPKSFNSRLKKLADARDFPKSERDFISQQFEQHIYFHGIESFLGFFYPDATCVLDYLPPSSILCFSGLTHIRQNFEKNIEELNTHQNKSSSLERLMQPEEICLLPSEIPEWLNYFPVIDFDPSASKETAQISAEMESNFHVSQKMSLALPSENSFDPLAKLIKERHEQQTALVLLASSHTQKERVLDLLKRFEFPFVEMQGNWGETGSGLFIREGLASSGFYWPEKSLWVLTDEEIFGQKIKKKSVKQNAGAAFTSFAQLHMGDYVVHQDQGIGIYRELLALTIGQTKNDFLLLEYLGGDKLYVPVDQINKIFRYEAKEGSLPLLDKMGGGTWKKTREKIKRATRKLARELLEMQAKRKMATGFAFSVRNVLFEQFEAAFPYDETPDQLKAIDDVVSDMESDRPMDRLVCGDVGYGKTEVAIRGAFKAVLDQKQVAILVPTTILSLQHYETFKKRFEGYAVNIAHLSRFQTPAEQKETLDKLVQGGVDIIIGTHRLISKDVKFRDLGLLIIDEEHRFGVAQKERIKKLKNIIDILSLSATPIPRSLNFSLVGIRDLSVINTPPEDRLSIRTFLTHFDETTLHDAITKELHRGGQIFFVHNRIQSIHSIQQKLQIMVPGARIRLAHGQMPEEELESVMIDFMRHQFDILLCTTIIESGLDIPNANTIIIDRADAMGLSQLYQLRGRVGRAAHRAYCYLLTPHNKIITDTARKRLDVVQRFTDLGAGFKIAMHDLEIRGAGNILGAEQSGHIAAIGYDLYIKLLEEAVQLLKNGFEEEVIDPELKFPVTASIPEEMVPDTGLRLILYKQLSSVDELENCEQIREEWVDRFGVLPIETENLILLIRIKVLARKLKIIFLGFLGESLTLRLHPQSPIPTDYFLSKVQKMPRKFKFLSDGRISIHLGETFEGDILKKTWQQLGELIHYQGNLS